MKPSICYIINDKIGGINSLNIALGQALPKETSFSQHFAYYHYKENKDARFNKPLEFDVKLSMLEYSKLDNIYYVFKKFEKQLPEGKGVLVSNDIFELHYIESFGTDKTVYQIVHDAYNLELSNKFEKLIDVFIAHSKFIYNKLLKDLPKRKDSIFYLPYGIEIPNFPDKVKTEGILNLVFLGRIAEQKGVYDLPKIDKALGNEGVKVNWTIIGRGPEKIKLKTVWSSFNKKVKYLSPQSREELNEILQVHDIFVFPTRFEGFPVALLETMALGIVPVVSDIPSGIPELVLEHLGFKVKPGDINGFVKAIKYLEQNRETLYNISKEAKIHVKENYELKNNMKAYHELFSNYKVLKKERADFKKKMFGSRLDKPWLPNILVRFIRKFIY